MTKNSLITILLLSFIILATPTIAEIDIITYRTTNTFSIATGGSSFDMCQCESLVDSFIITNTGQFGNIFTITTDKPSALTFSTATVELMPGESSTVFMYINAACNKEYEKAVVISVQDIFSNVESFEKSWSVNKCQNLMASLAVFEADNLPCTPQTFELLVENTGVFTETYEVNFGGEDYEEFFDKPYQSLIIPVGEQGVANATLSLDCDISGTHTIPFYVYATNNDLLAELTHDIVVESDYDFSLEANIEEMCAGDEKQFPITITNTASIENTFDLFVEAPFFVTLEETNITLSAGEERVVMLGVDSSINNAANYNLVIDAVGRTGGFSNTLEQALIINDCYGVSANIDLQEDIYDCSGYHEYPVIIKNTGSVEETIDVTVEGSEYATLSEEEVSLEANETTTLSLIIDVPPAVALDTSLVVKANLQGVELSARDTISVTQITENDCYKPTIIDQKKKASYLDEQVYFTIQNEGLAYAEYDLEYQGDAFFALSDVSKEAKLGSNDLVDIALLTYQNGPDAQKRYSSIISLTTMSADGERVLQYDFPITVTMHARFILLRWYDAAYDYFSVNTCHFVTSVLLLFLLIGGLIVGCRNKGKRKGKKGLLGLLLLIWLVLAGLALIFFGLPNAVYEPITPSNDSLTIRFAEDTAYVLDIGQYFIDEDGDDLVFDVSMIENVSVFVENDTATFVPDNDWFGERRFRIVAYDGEGGETESPRLDLEVIDRAEHNAWTLYNKYCLYINLVLLLLVFLIVDALFEKRVYSKEEKAEMRAKAREKKKLAREKKKAAAKKKKAKKKKSSKKKKK